MDRLEVPWTEAVLALLRDWRDRAAASAEAHYQRATALPKRVVALGTCAVVLSSITASWLLGRAEGSPTVWMIFGLAALGAAGAACFQIILDYGQYAAGHLDAAERWGGIRREIDEMLALHPAFLAERSDPKVYLDDLRARMDEIPAPGGSVIGHARWRRIAAQERLERRAAAIASARRGAVSPWPAAIRREFEDWERRAAGQSYGHLALARRFASLNVMLGAPAAVCMATVAIVCFTYAARPLPSARLGLGIVCVLASLAAGLNTLLRASSRSQQHGFAAEQWALLRRELAGSNERALKLAETNIHEYAQYIRRRMDDTAAQSPAMQTGGLALAGESWNLSVSAETARERFMTVFPGVDLRDEDERLVEHLSGYPDAWGLDLQGT